jgi:alkylation response protein AidB-like acyl-CoA dehydrogenase
MPLPLPEELELFHETSVNYISATCPVTRVRELAEDPVGFDSGYLEGGARLGWFAPFVAEAHGGGTLSGRPALDAAAIAHLMGRFLQPGPYLATTLVAAALARSGTDHQRDEVLPELTGGRAVATWALADGNGEWSDPEEGVTATEVAGGFRLSGAKSFVQDAGAARWILVTARSAGGPTQFLVPGDAPGVAVEPLRSFDLARRFHRVHLDVVVPDAAVLGRPGGAGADVDWQRDVAMTLVAAETAGAMERMFEMALQHAKDRIAFGRPIGSFQAIKHLLADLSLSVEMVQAGVMAAAHAVDDDAEARSEVAAMVKAFVGERAVDLSQGCLQVHGGIGYAWDFDLHLYMRRVSSNNAWYGDPTLHRERLCAAHGL